MARFTFHKDAHGWKHVFPTFSRQSLWISSDPLMIPKKYKLAKPSYQYFENISAAAQELPPGTQFDSIVVAVQTWNSVEINKNLPVLNHWLDDCGRLTFLFPRKLKSSEKEILDSDAADYGMLCYHRGAVGSGRRGISIWAIIMVKITYNPVAHARSLSKGGNPKKALAVLEDIPELMIQDNDMLALIALEKQKYYLACQKQLGPDSPPHVFFSKERREFAQVTALKPDLRASYAIHAQFWDHLGNADMAYRVMRSIDYLHSDDSYGEARLKISITNHQPDSKQTPGPLWESSSAKPRILIITHDYSDYGLDTLYHGLCTVLGQENIVEFPWKPTLHGQNIEAANNYPCVFNYPGGPSTAENLEDELRRGKFDLILYADVVQMAHQDNVRRLVNANPRIPLVLYDTWDDCYTPISRILDYIGRDRFDLVFKREMLNGVDYGSNTFPLPFGYAPDFITPQAPPGPKRSALDPFFWAGKSEYGLRPLYIRSLEARLGKSLEKRYDQNTYRRILANSKIGLSFFGCGFDSVRYWELPAHGVMLLAERPPIQIPYDFEEDRSAAFFDDLQEMNAKLDYYLTHPEEAERIAAAGHSHYLKHHTTEARTRQFLGRVDHELHGRLSALSSGEKNVSTISRKQRSVQSVLYMGLVKGENYGWGVCSKYLARELAKIRSIHLLSEDDGTAHNPQLGGKVFQAITDVNFIPLFRNARGTHNFGYTFFENELTPNSVENAKRYDLILAGSTWCKNRILDKGISNCDVLIQGIDPTVFYPSPKITDCDRFVIFSGGKFELRKGQDLVLKAFKILQDKYTDIFLVNCWYNMWPESIRQMESSPYITFNYDAKLPWQRMMQQTYHNNGIDPGRVSTLELVPQNTQRELFYKTNIGVFPNRCEGGTNLVMMEYMACGKPVIASLASGHKDIVTNDTTLPLTELKPINIQNSTGRLIGRWEEPSLEELVSKLEYAYHHREQLDGYGRRAAKRMHRFTWQKCSERLNRLIAS
jgi:glycosyltransferase involved in cell wall biosynthesis